MFAQGLAKFSDICHNENVNKNRGIWMSGSMMERLEENKFLITQSPNHLITFKNVCCGFHLNNILTILTPLTFTLCDRAETLAMTAFAGGGLKL